MAKTDNKSNPSSSSTSASDTKTGSGSTKTDGKDSKTDSKDSEKSSASSFTRGERQKVVTDSYRNSWDHIFEKKKKY